MHIGFTCPDGETVSFKNCLSGCRMQKRLLAGMCCSRPTRARCSFVRKSNNPSVTKMIQGTEYAVLERKHDYYKSIRKMTYLLRGNLSHEQCDVKVDNSINENRLEYVFEDGVKITGQFDHVDFAVDNDNVLYDYKTTKYFKVKKAVGLDAYKVPDPEGNVYKNNREGKWKKGDLKMVNAYRKSPDKADKFDWDLQSNMYRIMIEKNLNKKIDRIIVQALIVDYAERYLESGIDNPELIPIPILPDYQVIDYFYNKTSSYLIAMSDDTPGSYPCTDTERWLNDKGEYKKCDDWCELKPWCSQYKDEEVIEL